MDFKLVLVVFLAFSGSFFIAEAAGKKGAQWVNTKVNQIFLFISYEVLILLRNCNHDFLFLKIFKLQPESFSNYICKKKDPTYFGLHTMCTKKACYASIQ